MSEETVSIVSLAQSELDEGKKNALKDEAKRTLIKIEVLEEQLKEAKEWLVKIENGEAKVQRADVCYTDAASCSTFSIV